MAVSDWFKYIKAARGLSEEAAAWNVQEVIVHWDELREIQGYVSIERTYVKFTFVRISVPFVKVMKEFWHSICVKEDVEMFKVPLVQLNNDDINVLWLCIFGWKVILFNVAVSSSLML